MKKGFTLIELLAVIVILAIIALIATPIILGIINDAREKANERSVELYASAVRNAIAAYQLTGLNAPKSFSDLTIQYDGDVKCSVQELYEDGSFYLEGCKVNNGTKEYSYGTKQGTSIEVGKMSICNPLSVQTEGVYTAGDKYECDVDPNKEGYDYIFYVLTTPASGAESVNLIMDSNINISGKAVKGEETDLGIVSWDADHLVNSYGPITAMTYLQTATSEWSNVNSQTISTFTDFSGNTHEIAQSFTVNARMPYLSEVNTIDESKNPYLYDNLHLGCYNDPFFAEEIACSDDVPADNKDGVDVEGLEHIYEVYGYWTLSSSVYGSECAWYVDYRGYTSYGDGLVSDVSFGVRPVINLSI